MTTLAEASLAPSMSATITERSKALFLEYAKDAGNWNGTPLVGGTKEDRGNLTQLKKAGLLVTFESDGEQWVEFTADGKAYAASLGVEVQR